jgi:hypothetical protein
MVENLNLDLGVADGAEAKSDFVRCSDRLEIAADVVIEILQHVHCDALCMCNDFKAE